MVVLGNYKSYRKKEDAHLRLKRIVYDLQIYIYIYIKKKKIV
jgi:hypothetical protein